MEFSVFQKSPYLNRLGYSVATARSAMVRYAKQAFNAYESQIDSSSVDRNRAISGWLKTYLSIANLEVAEANDLSSLKTTQFEKIKQQLINSIEILDNHSGYDETKTRIAIADLLIELSSLDSGADHVAERYLKSVIEDTRLTQNNYLHSYALGAYGVLLQNTGQTQTSIGYLEKAADIAQSRHHWRGVYRWQWELAQIYVGLNQRDQALAAYDLATDAISRVIAPSQILEPELQYSFKEKLEPVYREYMSLLLDSHNPDLEKIAEVFEQTTPPRIGELPSMVQVSISLRSESHPQHQPKISFT